MLYMQESYIFLVGNCRWEMALHEDKQRLREGAEPDTDEAYFGRVWGFQEMEASQWVTQNQIAFCVGSKGQAEP